MPWPLTLGHGRKHTGMPQGCSHLVNASGGGSGGGSGWGSGWGLRTMGLTDTAIHWTPVVLPVVSQQAATPTLPESSTVARADAAPAISRNADQLRAIPRRLQNPTTSGLQCLVIVNSTGGNHSRSTKLVFSQVIYLCLFWHLFLFFSPPRVLSRSRYPCVPVFSSSSVPTHYLFHGPPSTVPRTSRRTIPWSPFLLVLPGFPTAPPLSLPHGFHGSCARSSPEIPSPLLVFTRVYRLRRKLLNCLWACICLPFVFRLVVWVAPVVRSRGFAPHSGSFSFPGV